MEPLSQDKPKSSGINFLPLIQWFTFLMVFSMTMGQKPIQKAIDAVSKKYEKQAQVKACIQIAEMKEMYTSFIGDVYKIGCIHTVRVQWLNLAKSNKERAEVKKIFNDEDSSLKYEHVKNWCAEMSASWQVENKVEEKITGNLGYTFKCRELTKEDYEKSE